MNVNIIRFFSRSVRFNLLLSLLCFIFSFSRGYAQVDSSGPSSLSLRECVEYALKHQPAINQALITVSIARTTNKINLSGWLPQAYVTGSFSHYIQLPTAYVLNSTTPGGAPIRQTTGVTNTAIPEFTVSQAIFSPALLYAGKAAPLYVKQAVQATDSARIGAVANVSKSFYSLLLTLEQIKVLKEDTVRLSQNVQDTYHQFQGGIVDETDFDQATITLNNSKAQLRQANENLLPQYANLKQLMGFPPEKQFNISFDTAAMKNDIGFDTTQQLQYEKRIEIQGLTTTKDLQHLTTDYYRHAFLPSISAFYDYNYEFENNKYADLYSNAFPNSLVGISLNLPIFTGFARLNNVKRSRLQEQLIDWSFVDLRSQIYSEYTSALATYRGNRYNLEQMESNVELAKKVYFIVNLQYKQGTVPYLNVITAESNLITSEINFNNALFDVLSSKIDLQKAMGIISY